MLRSVKILVLANEKNHMKPVQETMVGAGLLFFFFHRITSTARADALS